jgi:hypothetical protein
MRNATWEASPGWINSESSMNSIPRTTALREKKCNGKGEKGFLLIELLIVVVFSSVFPGPKIYFAMYIIHIEPITLPAMRTSLHSPLKSRGCPPKN